MRAPESYWPERGAQFQLKEQVFARVERGLIASHAITSKTQEQAINEQLWSVQRRARKQFFCEKKRDYVSNVLHSGHVPRGRFRDSWQK